MCQLARLVAPGGPAGSHRLRMRGRVPHRDQAEIALLYHDVSRIVYENAPEGEVALGTRSDSDLEGGPQVAGVGVS